MTHTLYLRSYDRFEEVLRYTLPEGEFAIIPHSQFIAGGMPLTFGVFTREGEHVAGVFASPEGPVFFLDRRCVVCQFGRTSAAATLAPGGHIRQFSLRQEGDGGEKFEFSLSYKEREGLGANPYDTELEDVDLFAMIATGLSREQFFRNYTKGLSL